MSDDGSNRMLLQPALQNGWDSRLFAFVQAQNDAEAESLLLSLLGGVVEPVAKTVVRRRLRAFASTLADGDEIVGDACTDAVTFVARKLRAARILWQQRTAPIAGQDPVQPIADIGAYTAATAGRVCDDLFRQHFPKRARLKNRVRYLLSHTPELGVWTQGETKVGGLRIWQTQTRAIVSLVDPQQWAEQNRAKLEAQSGESSAPAFCHAVLSAIGGPIALDELVGVLAALWHIRDEPVARNASGLFTTESFDTHVLYSIEDGSVALAQTVEKRETLRLLWAEIRELPPKQCAALLLNLRDHGGRGVIALLPLLHIATTGEIAQALHLSPADLQTLWNELPLEDNAIAQLLGATRQQVINLRKVARARLNRRASKWNTESADN